MVRGNLRTMLNDDAVMWSLVSDISQSMQIAFASIKAATSSLLGGDIFWDAATQHEFMQTVDNSVDDLSDLTAVMTMAMRSQNGTLALRLEPNSLQEILSRAKDEAQKHARRAVIELTLPAETRLARVDFECLLMGLRLLVEVLISTRENQSAPLSIQLQEDAEGWQILFHGGISGFAADIVNWMCTKAPEGAFFPAALRAETKLKALTATKLLALHAIRMTSSADDGSASAGEVALALHVPIDTGG